MEEEGDADPIRVLHVDDEPEFARMVANHLERTDESLSVQPVMAVEEALARIERGRIDCVISDYDMPTIDGLALMEAVREREPDLPFILLTGKGSERLASESISAGVTDYFRKSTDSEQYAVLANRITNAVDRRRAERELAEQERWFRAVIEQSKDLVTILDTDGTITYQSPSGHVLGFSRSQMTGETIFEHVHPEDRESTMAKFFRLVEDPDLTPTAEFRLRNADGEWRWIESTAQNRLDDPMIDGILVNSRDVTERKQRERELAAERDRFAKLFENVDDPIVEFAFEGQEPIVRAVNPAFEETFGYDGDRILGESIDDLIVPEDRMGEAATLNRQVRSGQPLDAEVRRETVDGCRDFLARVAVPDGDRTGFAIYTDITDRKQRERALARQNERLDEFASVVSHDLRNPLGVARGRLQLASEDCESEHLDHIATAHDRMDALIEDLLALARQGETVDETRPVPLEQAVTEAWATVDTTGANLDNAGSLTLEADENRLCSLLENLFANAIEHGATGSRNGDPEVTVTVDTLEDGSGFVVADDGTGIPPEERDSVFESGYTTAEEGTGFGLSIVKQIVEAHGWEVSITDSVDGGARFEIRTG